MTTSEWTDEDRVLMLARLEHKATLCPGCGHPKATAWHWENDGWFEVPPDGRVTCHGCTAMKYPDGMDTKSEPVEYMRAVDTRDYAVNPLPVIDLNKP